MMTVREIVSEAYPWQLVKVEYPVDYDWFEVFDTTADELCKHKYGVWEDGLSNWDRMEVEPIFTLDDNVRVMWTCTDGEDTYLVLTLEDKYED